MESCGLFSKIPNRNGAFGILTGLLDGRSNEYQTVGGMVTLVGKAAHGTEQSRSTNEEPSWARLLSLPRIRKCRERLGTPIKSTYPSMATVHYP